MDFVVRLARSCIHTCTYIQKAKKALEGQTKIICMYVCMYV